MHFYQQNSIIAYTPMADTGDCTEGSAVIYSNSRSSE